MKTKSLWLSQRGFSLVEVLMAIGMLSFVALLAARMQKNQDKATGDNEKKMDYISVLADMKEVLANKKNCLATFGGQTPLAFPKTVNTIYRSDGATNVALWTAGTAVGTSGSLTLTSITMTGSSDVATSWIPDPKNPAWSAFAPVAWHGRIKAKILLTKNGTFQGPSTVKGNIQLMVKTNGSNQISECYTNIGTKGMGDMWALADDGVYFSDITGPRVTIGATIDITSPAILQVKGNAIIGANASVGGNTSYTLGGDASPANSVALGENAQAGGVAIGSVVIGSSSAADAKTWAWDHGCISIGSANTWNPSGTSYGNKASNCYDNGIAISSAGDNVNGATAIGPQLFDPFSIAIGPRADSNGGASMSIGPLSSTGGMSAGEKNLRPFAIAIGYQSNSSDSKTISIGYMAAAGGNSTDNNVDNLGAVALGYSADSVDIGTLAIGRDAHAGQDGEATVTATPTPGFDEGDHAIAIGWNSKAYDFNDISIGTNAITGNAALGNFAAGAIALGEQSSALADSAIAVGYLSSAVAVNSMGLGLSASANGISSIAIGTNALTAVGATSSIAIGRQAQANASTTIALGSGAISQGLRGVSIGYLSSDSVGGYGVAIGKQANAGGTNAVAIGYQAQALALNSLALLGNVSNAAATESMAMGLGADISGAFTSSMVIAPNSADTVNAIQSSEFLAHFQNGFKFCTGNTLANACLEGYEILDNGATAALSDENLKQNFELVDAEHFIDRFLNLDVSWWNYKTAPEDQFRQIGPMAQDFKRAFGTHGSEKFINQLDADGVMMAGVKGLAIRNKKLEAQVAQLENERLEIQHRLEELEAEADSLIQ